MPIYTPDKNKEKFMGKRDRGREVKWEEVKEMREFGFSNFHRRGRPLTAACWWPQMSVTDSLGTMSMTSSKRDQSRGTCCFRRRCCCCYRYCKSRTRDSRTCFVGRSIGRLVGRSVIFWVWTIIQSYNRCVLSKASKMSKAHIYMFWQFFTSWIWQNANSTFSYNISMHHVIKR